MSDLLPVPGANFDEQVRELAGLLAERSLTTLTVVAGNSRHGVAARATDLPGTLVRLLQEHERLDILGPAGAVASLTRESMRIAPR